MTCPAGPVVIAEAISAVPVLLHWFKVHHRNRHSRYRDRRAQAARQFAAFIRRLEERR